MLGAMRDVTERRQAAQALLASEESYRRLVELAQEGIVTVDVEERIMFTNPAFLVAMGYTREELLGRSLLEFLRRAWADGPPCAVRSSGGGAWCRRTRSRWPPSPGAQDVSRRRLPAGRRERALRGRAWRADRRHRARARGASAGLRRRSWRAWACSPAASRTTSTTCWSASWATPTWRCWSCRTASPGAALARGHRDGDASARPT